MIYFAIVLGPVGFLLGALTGSLLNALIFGGIGFFGPVIFIIVKMEKNIIYLRTKNDELIDKVDKLIRQLDLDDEIK